MPATITEPTNRYSKNNTVHTSIYIFISTYCKNACVCVFVFQIQVGVEFEASTRTQETTTSFGYQMELPEANMVFRGKFHCFVVMLEENHSEVTQRSFSAYLQV